MCAVCKCDLMSNFHRSSPTIDKHRSWLQRKLQYHDCSMLYMEVEEISKSRSTVCLENDLLCVCVFRVDGISNAPSLLPCDQCGRDPQSGYWQSRCDTSHRRDSRKSIAFRGKQCVIDKKKWRCRHGNNRMSVWVIGHWESSSLCCHTAFQQVESTGGQRSGLYRDVLKLPTDADD